MILLIMSIISCTNFNLTNREKNMREFRKVLDEGNKNKIRQMITKPRGLNHLMGGAVYYEITKLDTNLFFTIIKKINEIHINNILKAIGKETRPENIEIMIDNKLIGIKDDRQVSKYESPDYHTSSLYKILCQAAEHINIELLTCLLRREKVKKETKDKLLLNIILNEYGQYYSEYSSFAFEFRKSDIDIVIKCLIKEGSNVNAKYRSGRTLLEVALSNYFELINSNDYKYNSKYNQHIPIEYKIIKILLENGAKVTNESIKLCIKNADEEENNIYEDLIGAASDINETDSEGNSLLMLAIKKLKYKMASLLIDKGADVNCINNKGENALFEIIYNKDNGSLLELLQLLQLLIDKGADVNCVNKKKETALLLLSINYSYRYSSDNKEICDILIKAGANVNVKDEKGNTLLKRYLDKHKSILSKKIILNGVEERGYVFGKHKRNFLEIIAMPNMADRELDLFINKNGVIMKRYCQNRIFVSFGIEEWEISKYGHDERILNLDKKSIIEILKSGKIDINDINDDGMSNLYHILRIFTPEYLGWIEYRTFLSHFLVATMKGSRLFAE